MARRVAWGPNDFVAAVSRIEDLAALQEAFGAQACKPVAHAGDRTQDGPPLGLVHTTADETGLRPIPTARDDHDEVLKFGLVHQETRAADLDDPSREPNVIGVHMGEHDRPDFLE